MGRLLAFHFTIHACTLKTEMKNVPTIFTSDIKGEHDSINQIAYLKKFRAPFHGWDSTISRIKATARKHFLPESPLELLVLIWSTSEG